MNSKIFSAGNFPRILAVVLVLGVASCAPGMVKPSPEPVQKPLQERAMPVKTGESQEPVTLIPEKSTEPPETRIKEEPIVEKSSPRMLASLQLTRDAESLIARGQADSAIRTLERAVAIDPSNGRNYYYLAEAWLIKGERDQAANYNELAAVHLGSDETWGKRIADQKQRIGNIQAR